MMEVRISLELILLVVAVFLSTLSVALAYDTRIFQKRTAVREALEQLDPFVETNPDFKISHSLIDFDYSPRTRGIVLLFRYISLFNPSSTQGGQARRFHEILRAGSPFPRLNILVDDIRDIEFVTDAEFTDRGLEVKVVSIDSVQIVDVVHQIQRIFRHQLRTLDTQQ